MNRSQYLPHAAYSITPYPQRFGAPGYQNVPGMASGPAIASATPVAYPGRTYIQQPHHQVEQLLYAAPYGGNSSVGAYAPVAGQIEDIVSPPANSHPSPLGKHHMSGRVRGHIPNGIHPSSLPQVQDVFGPRQPHQQAMATPFGAPMPLPMAAPGGTSRMVGAYPPMPPQQQPGVMPSTMSTPSPMHSQGSSPTIGMVQGAHDPIMMGMGMGMGMVRLAGGGPAQGYGQYTNSP